MGNLVDLVEHKYNSEEGSITIIRKTIEDLYGKILADQEKLELAQNEIIINSTSFDWNNVSVPDTKNIGLAFGVSGGTDDYPNFDGLSPFIKNGIARYEQWNSMCDRAPNGTYSKPKPLPVGDFVTGANPVGQDFNAPMWKINNTKTLSTILSIAINVGAKPGDLTRQQAEEVYNRVNSFVAQWQKVIDHVYNSPAQQQNTSLWGGFTFADNQRDFWKRQAEIILEAIKSHDEKLVRIKNQIQTNTKQREDLINEENLLYVKYDIEKRLAFAEEENIADYKTTFDAVRSAYESGNYAEAKSLLDQYDASELAQKVEENLQAIRIEEAENLAELNMFTAEQEAEVNKMLAEKKLTIGVLLAIGFLVLFFVYLLTRK